MEMFEDQMDNLEHYAINSKKKGRRKRFCPYDREFYELTRFFKTQDSNLRFYKTYCYIGLYKNNHLWFFCDLNKTYQNRYFTTLFIGTEYKAEKIAKIPELGYSKTVYSDPWSEEMKTENQLKVYNEYKRLVNEVNKSNDMN